MIDTLPASWQDVLGEELHKPYFKELAAFVAEERARGPVHPPRGAGLRRARGDAVR